MRIPLLGIPERAVRTVRDIGGPTASRLGSTVVEKGMDAGITAVGVGLGLLQRLRRRDDVVPAASDAATPAPAPDAATAVPEPPEAMPPLAAAAGAPGAATPIVEEARREVPVTSTGDLAADELPLEDFDHLTMGSLRARLPRLEVGELIQLVDYEKAHANRLTVVTMLENRIAKVRAAG